MSSQYYTVVCSLPRISAHFKIEETPISRLQLEKRLKLLPAEKYTVAFTLEFLMWTSWFMPYHSVTDLRNAFQDVVRTQSPFLRDMLIWFFDLRSVIAALRMRNDTKEPPENSQEYWITQWEHKLIRNWSEPDFGLKAIYPWFPKMTQDIARKDTVAVEQFLLASIWKYLSVIETGHYFDFEAIIIYVLRWNIIHYWSQFNKEKALTCLNELSNLLLSQQLPKEVILNDKGSVS
ncbi:MAG: DUF2764 family protein [Legionella sp.]